MRRREQYRIARVHSWPDGHFYIQVTNCRDCMSADTLSPIYKEERQGYWDPREALKAAFAVRKQWGKAEYISLWDGEDDHNDDELVALAQSAYDALPKCELCGDLIEYETYQFDDIVLCSESCAEKVAWRVEEQVTSLL